MKEADDGFSLLFTPGEDVSDPQSWLEHVRGTHDSNDILSGVEDAAAVGIVRDHSKSGKTYIFHETDQIGQGSGRYASQSQEVSQKNRHSA